MAVNDDGCTPIVAISVLENPSGLQSVKFSSGNAIVIIARRLQSASDLGDLEISFGQHGDYACCEAEFHRCQLETSQIRRELEIPVFLKSSAAANVH